MEMKESYLYAASIKTKEGTKWGYINEEGEFVIQPHFDFANDFQNNGLATVEINKRYGCINDQGHWVIAPKFETIIDFSEGRASVVFDGRFRVIDEQGYILTYKPYNFISMYQDGRAMFSDIKEGKFLYGYLDRNGNEVIPLRFLMANDFKDGLAVVQTAKDRFALIDRYGNEIDSFHYAFVGHYGEAMIVFQRSFQEQYGYLDVHGQMIIEPRFSSAQAFENKRAIVASPQYGLINKKGFFVIEPHYNDVIVLGENRIAVGKAINEEKPFLGSIYAVVNWNGELLTEFKYDHISLFDQGIASVKMGDRAYFIDRSGKRARGLPIVTNVDSVTLVHRLVRALKSSRVSYLDRKGHLVWKQNTIIPLTKRYRVLEKCYQPNKDIIIFYPQLDGLKLTVVEVLVNKKLKKLSIAKKIDESEQLDYSYSGDFNVTFYKNNLVVIELYGYQYYFGAAHGMPSKIYANINLINGRFYELEDMFKKDSHFVERLSEFIAEKIKTDLHYDYVFPGAYKGISKDQPFYVLEEALVIYFEPYEIGPYAAGFPTFTIPFSDIIDMIDRKSEFWLSFH